MNAINVVESNSLAFLVLVRAVLDVNFVADIANKVLKSDV